MFVGTLWNPKKVQQVNLLTSLLLQIFWIKSVYTHIITEGLAHFLLFLKINLYKKSRVLRSEKAVSIQWKITKLTSHML